MAATRIADLAAIIDALESKGRLARVKSEVDPRHELAGIAHALAGGSRAVLFESVKGHRWPVLAGLYWNRALLAELLGCGEAALPQHIAAGIATWRAAPADPVVVKSGPVLDVTERDVDLGTIPVPVHALDDVAPRINAAVVIAKDPETGARHALIPRFEVAGRDALRIEIVAGDPLGEFLEAAKRLGRSLWITLNCGAGPGLHFAATASADAAASGRDPLGIASAFEGTPFALVPGTESDVEMAAHAMWALECEIVPGEVAAEGPRQIVRVRRMHRRARPVFQTILPGLEAGNAFGLAAEARVLSLLQQQVPGVIAVHFTLGGAGLHQAVVQIAARRTGGSKQAILAALAAFPPLRMVTIVDDDVDIRSPEDVAWAMATRFNAATGIVRIDNAGHGLESAAPGSIGAKIGFDATQPSPKRAGFERASFKAVALGEHEIAGIAQPVAAAPVRAAAPVTRAASADWDENRWLQRELEAMRRDGNGTAAPGAKPALGAKTAPAASAPVAPPAIANSAAAARKSKDWDEDRWLQRELEAMKRERALKPAPRPAPALRVAERPADDEDGSFFRGGAA